MSKQFVEGNKYVFVTKKCKKDMKRSDGRWGGHSIWAKEINGMIVNIESPIIARCKCYLIEPTWCKCIGRDVDV